MTLLRYSQAALILAVGYLIYQFTTHDYSAWGIQFRFLTIWGLTAARVAHYLLFAARRNGRSDSYPAFISATAVLNIMVVFLYWRLFFIDPALVNGDNTPVWFQEYYLHLIGPAIILIDALFISRAFDQLVRGAAGTIALCVAFVVWTEGFVGPFNDTPVGSVTSGLTYPFLNDMDMGGRMNFYATTIVTALVFYLICWAVAWGMRKIRG